MKRALLILLGLSSASSQAIEMDKIAHFGAGYICQDVLYEAFFKPEVKPHRVGIIPEGPLAPVLMTAGTCFVFGMFKEIVDAGQCQERTGGPCNLDGGDLLANGLGIASKSLLQWKFEF